MAHSRVRHLQGPFVELMQFASLIGVLGHRQVGKTTFLESQCSTYLTFDDEDTLSLARKNPKKFIESLHKKNTAIDESQWVPGIFPALKERVRVNKRPGQFVLSGSVRFTSKKEIRESLTGRIQYLELLPFSLRELDHEPLSSYLSLMFQTKRIEDLAHELQKTQVELNRKMKMIDSYRVKGGLPGVCFIRKVSLFHGKVFDQLKTILDRDLRQVYATKLSFDELYAFLKEVALNEGEPYSLQEMRRKTGLNPLTQKNLLSAFESIFLLRRIKIEGDQGSHTYFLEDQGESHLITENRLKISQQYLSLVYRNVRAEYFYRIGQSVEAFQFRNRSHTVIPLVFRAGDSYVGFLFSEGGVVDRKIKGAAGSFLRQYPNSRVFIIHLGSELRVVDSRILLCPLACLV